MDESKREKLNVHIRWMIRRDLPDVLRIEWDTHGPAWTEELFLIELRKRNVIGLVAELDEKVLGFAIYELNRGSIEVLNMGVDPAKRRRGIGSQFVAKLAGKLNSQRRKSIDLRVREGNLAMQLFLKSAGFRATGVERGFYQDPDEDAYVMAYTIAEPARVAVGAGKSEGG